MKRWINILLGVLAVQAALFVFLTYQESSNSSGIKQSEPLLALEFDKIDKVTVEGADKKLVEILKKDGKWILPGLFNFPLANDKIQQVLKHLVEAKRSWALGNTKAAAKQFEVTDEKFERKFTFFVDGKAKTTLYLGNSPSYRKVYARVDQEDKTYSVEFNTVDAPMTAKEWADRDAYKIDRSKIAQIKFQDFTLNREDSSFAISGLKADEITNTTEVDNLLNRLQNQAFEDVLASGTFETGKQLLEYTIVNEDKTERKFTYFAMKSDATKAVTKSEDKDAAKTPEEIYAVLKVSDLPYFFQVHKIRVEELSKFQHSKFVKKKESADKKSTSSLDKEAGQIQIPAGGPG